MTDAVFPARYAFNAQAKGLYWDYARGIFSLAFVWVLFSAVPAGHFMWWLLLVLVIAFAGYVANTIWRHGLRLEMDEDGITAGWRNPFDPAGLILLQKRRLPWSGLKELKVRYFSRQKNAKESPWLMVKLEGENDAGRRVRITFDATHEGFRPVLLYVMDLVEAGDIWVDEPTLANLEALNIGAAAEEEDA